MALFLLTASILVIAIGVLGSAIAGVVLAQRWPEVERRFPFIAKSPGLILAVSLSLWIIGTLIAFFSGKIFEFLPLSTPSPTPLLGPTVPLPTATRVPESPYYRYTAPNADVFAQFALTLLIALVVALLMFVLLKHISFVRGFAAFVQNFSGSNVNRIFLILSLAT